MNFEFAQKVPIKISPCPIIESVVELKFESKTPPMVIPGIVYDKLKGTFPILEKLPVMEFPSAIRDNDPNFKYSPYFRMRNKDFIVQIGPRCFSVLCPKEYKGWTLFKKQIEEVFQVINGLKIIDQPIRLGVRYINFFDNKNIFEKIKIKLELASYKLIGDDIKNVVHTELVVGNFRSVIQLANNATLNSTEKGSTVDIDISTDDTSIILKDFVDIVEKAHETEKKIFFGVLKEDFINEYSPVWSE